MQLHLLTVDDSQSLYRPKTMLRLQREHDDRATVRVVERKNRYGQNDRKGGLEP